MCISVLFLPTPFSFEVLGVWFRKNRVPGYLVPACDRWMGRQTDTPPTAEHDKNCHSWPIHQLANGSIYGKSVRTVRASTYDEYYRHKISANRSTVYEEIGYLDTGQIVIELSVTSLPTDCMCDKI